MRAAIGSIGVAAAGILLALALWPDPQGGPAVGPVVAQDTVKVEIGEDAKEEKEPARLSEEELNARTMEKLSKPMSAEFFDTHLVDVFPSMSQMVGVQFYVDSNSLDDDGIDVAAPITLTLQVVPAAMVLDLVLAQLDLGYTLRSGVIIVTTQAALEEILEIRVYNVKDLLNAKKSQSPTVSVDAVININAAAKNLSRLLQAQKIGDSHGLALELTELSHKTLMETPRSS